MATATATIDMERPETAATLEDIKCAYKLGVTEGKQRAEQRVQRSIKCLVRANRELLNLIRVFDMDFPLQAVTLPLPLAEEVLKVLRNRCSDAKLIGEFEHVVEVCRGKCVLPADEIKEELEVLVG
jgi:hypothetical protein